MPEGSEPPDNPSMGTPVDVGDGPPPPEGWSLPIWSTFEAIRAEDGVFEKQQIFDSLPTTSDRVERWNDSERRTDVYVVCGYTLVCIALCTVFYTLRLQTAVCLLIVLELGTGISAVRSSAPTHLGRSPACSVAHKNGLSSTQ